MSEHGLKKGTGAHAPSIGASADRASQRNGAPRDAPTPLMTLWLRAHRDPLVLDIARDLEARGFRIDVEYVEAIVAKLRAARKNDTRTFIDEYDQKIEARNQAGIMRLIPPAMQRSMQARAIQSEIRARAAELRECGVSNPVTQAENEAAKRHGFRNGANLNRWIRRNR